MNHAAAKRKDKGKSMIGYLIAAKTGNIGNGDSKVPCCIEIEIVDANSVADYAAKLSEILHHVPGDRRPLNEEHVGFSTSANDVLSVLQMGEMLSSEKPAASSTCAWRSNGRKGMITDDGFGHMRFT